MNGSNSVTIDCDGPGQGKGKGQQVACVAKQIKTYATNGQGNGVENSIQTGSREILFNYDGYRLLGEYDLNGNPVQETVWLGNLPVATIQNGNTYYIHTDHLGTPRVITDSDNTEVWKWESDPFGVAVTNEDPDGDGVHFSYNLRFPGQYYDEETGKHYNYFRDYDPGTGRYIESDPIGLYGGLNTYAYIGGSPLNLSDPLGLAATCDEPPSRCEKQFEKSSKWPGVPDGYKVCSYSCKTSSGVHTIPRYVPEGQVCPDVIENDWVPGTVNPPVPDNSSGFVPIIPPAMPSSGGGGGGSGFVPKMPGRRYPQLYNN